MMAIKTIKKGEEIFNDYGALPRSDLLRRYGYITSEYNQWDVVELRTENLVTIVMQEIGVTTKDVERRVTHLEVLGRVLVDAENLGCPGSTVGLVGGDLRYHTSSREWRPSQQWFRSGAVASNTNS